jgi:uncharacterized protein (TIGR02266 family)
MIRTKDEAEVTARVVDRTTATAQVLVREAAAERRGQPRYDVTIKVTLLGDHNFYMGLTENISEGGLFVQTQRLLPMGTTLRMEFSLPTSSEAISAVGEVRWVRSANAVREEHNNFGSGGEDAFKPGMGIQFKELSPETAAAIAEFIQIRKPDFYAE